MELDVRIGDKSLSTPIDNPFSLDIDAVVKEIEELVSSGGSRLEGLDVRGLIPKMVRGIAGCEDGCPSNAMAFVSAGFRNFELKYVEGGILTARAMTADKKELVLRMFPDFD